MSQILNTPRSAPRPTADRRGNDRRGSESGGLRALVAGADFFLFALTVLLSSFGVLMIYSATRDTQTAAGLDPKLYLAKQTVFLGLGLCGMFVTMSVNYRKLLDLSPVLYGLGVLLLIGVLFAPAQQGIHGWFQFGQFQFQPSEFVKIALILGLAAYAGEQRDELDSRRIRNMVLIAALPIGLVFIEPDLGGALVYGFILLAILWVAGAGGRQMLMMFAVLVATAGIGVKVGILEKYQVERLTSFVSTPAPQVRQSMMTIGSGGMTGRGLFAGSLTKFGYVSERHTDFIFSVVGEQLGLIGAIILLTSLMVLCWRMLRIGSQARDSAGRLICVGVLGFFLFQIFENVGMTMQVLPVTGIPLPLISYGGSSTIAEFVALGLVLNVSRFRFR